MAATDKILNFFTAVNMVLEAGANLLDLYRVVPRTFMFSYCWILYQASTWFMALPDPNGAQATFISIVYGAAAGLFGLYVGSKRTTGKITQPPAEQMAH